MEKPPVFYHTMGKVKYYYGETWPLPQTKFTPYYFASEKGANSADGDGRLQMEIPTDGKAFDKYDYDPADPVPCRSGLVISPGDSLRQSQAVVAVSYPHLDVYQRQDFRVNTLKLPVYKLR